MTTTPLGCAAVGCAAVVCVAMEAVGWAPQEVVLGEETAEAEAETATWGVQAASHSP